MESIIFIISIILINTAYLLLKKSEEKLNILYELIKLAVINICYNIFIVFMLSSFSILSTLVNLSVVNIAISLILAIVIFKQKTIQRYYIKIRDIIAIMLILIVLLIIAYKNFGMPINVTYRSSDAMVHYVAANEFYESSRLLQHIDKTTVFNLKDMMPGAYVNIGILFKVASNFISENNFYKIFIIFDILILFLGATLFYFTINKYVKNKVLLVLAYVFSILYFLGYPLNNMQMGFFYLGMGIVIVNLIINLINEYVENKNKNNKIILVALLFLANMGIFFTYYLFMPVIYLAELIYFIYYFKKEKRLFTKESIVTILIALIIPALVGIAYFILPAYLNTSGEITKQTNALKLDGLIYKDFYTNFVLIIPFTLYYIWNLIKKKKITIEFLAIACLAVFMYFLFIGLFNGNVSAYYFFKTHYLLWLLVHITMFAGIAELYNREKTIVIALLIVYFTSLSIHFFDVDKKTFNASIYGIIEKPKGLVSDIYWTNKRRLTDEFKKEIEIITEKDMELINFVKNENLHKDNITYTVGRFTDKIWSYAILRSINNIVEEELENGYEIDISKWENDTNSNYLIYFSKDNNIERNKEEFSKHKVIYENEEGFIVEKQN